MDYCERGETSRPPIFKSTKSGGIRQTLGDVSNTTRETKSLKRLLPSQLPSKVASFSATVKNTAQDAVEVEGADCCPDVEFAAGRMGDEESAYLRRMQSAGLPEEFKLTNDQMFPTSLWVDTKRSQEEWAAEFTVLESQGFVDSNEIEALLAVNSQHQS